MFNFFALFRGPSQAARKATELYGSIVTQARQPTFYIDYGVPDVAEKRYELIVLHLVVVLERLRAAQDRGDAVRQELVEAFVRDLDGSIREMAVGDTKVPSNVKKAAAGLLDRDVLYRQAFAAEDDTGLQQTGSAPDSSSAERSADDMTLVGLLSELVFDGGNARGTQALYSYTLAVRQALRNGQTDLAPGDLIFARPEDYLTEVGRGSR